MKWSIVIVETYWEAKPSRGVASVKNAYRRDEE